MTSASMVLIPREDPVGKLVFVVIVLALGVLFFIALMVLLTAMLPGTARRSKAVVARTPIRAFLVGFVACAVFGAWAGYLFSGSYVRLLLKTEWIWSKLAGGLGIVALLMIIASFGVTGVIACVGDRIATLAGREWSSMKKVILGSLVLVLAGWFPVVGWLVVSPIALSISFGSSVLGWLSRPDR